MATKIVFAVFAAMCIIASAAATPAAFRHSEEVAELQTLDLKYGWPQPADILEKIQEILNAVQAKIAEVTQDVQETTQVIIDVIEDIALKAAAKWSEDVQKWADQAAAAGVDIQDCIDKQDSLADVIAAIKDEANQCAADSLDDLMTAVEDAKDVVPRAQAVIAEAKQTVDECQKKGNIATIGVCLIAALPRIQVKAGKVLTEATILATIVTVKAVTAGPAVSLCASAATAKHAAEATTIVNNTVDCIKGKLNP